MNRLSEVFIKINKYLPYLLLIILYFFFINIEAKKRLKYEHSVNQENYKNRKIIKKTRILIPVIPFKENLTRD